jgi:hypothetical protein
MINDKRENAKQEWRMTEASFLQGLLSDLIGDEDKNDKKLSDELL